MELKVELLSGLIGEYVSADCYIDGEYFDFYTSTKGVKLVNEWGFEVPLSISEYTSVEQQIRQQFEDKQSEFS